MVGFRASSTRAAKRLWRSCTEQHSFFRTFRPINPLPPNSKPKGISSLLNQLVPLKSCFYDTGESGSNSSGHHQSITYRRYDLHRVASAHPGGTSAGSPSPRPAWSSTADETEPIESSMDDLKTSLKMMVHHPQHLLNYSSTCSGGSAASPISSLAFKGPPSGSFNYADDSCATDGSSSSHNSTPEEISGLKF